MATFVKLRLSELVVNHKGQLCNVEGNRQKYSSIFSGSGGETDNAFSFNMLCEVEGAGICFGFSPKYIDERLGW